MTAIEKRLEGRLRRLARREGYRIVKSRRYSPAQGMCGEYMLVDDRNLPAIGGSYDASLDEIEAFLRD